MPSELANPNANFSLVPATLDEAMKYSEMIAKSDVVPKDYKGKPENVLVAIQMGMELGLPPLQALQNIAVINGRPGVYGDSLIAICRAHPAFESIVETFDEANMEATCVAKRKGEEPQTQTFSKTDAEIAGLWKKQGPWTQYPKRMLQMRARGFALRDVFPDALRGVQLIEEIQDIPPEKDITPAKETDPALDDKTKTESLSSNLAKQADDAVVVDADTGEIDPQADSGGPSEADVIAMASRIKDSIAAVTTPAEWNTVAEELAENQQILGGRYASLKKKCNDKRTTMEKEAAPAPQTESAPPAQEAGDPGF